MAPFGITRFSHTPHHYTHCVITRRQAATLLCSQFTSRNPERDHKSSTANPRTEGQDNGSLVRDRSGTRARETAPGSGCRLSVSVKYVQVYSQASRVSTCRLRGHIDLLFALWLQQGWWHRSKSTDFLEADTEPLEHKGWKIRRHNHHLPVSKREREASVLTGGPTKNERAIQD